MVILGFFSVPMLDGANQAAAKTTQEYIDEYKELINQLEKEQQDIQAEINELKKDKNAQTATKNAIQKKIDNLQNQINTCQNQLDSYASQIKQCEDDIVKKEAEFENTKYLFRQRLRAIYMNGGMTASSLAALLSAEDLSELLTKAELTKSISAYDNALMEKIVKDVESIEENKAQIKELAKSQEAVKATLDAKKGELMTEMKAVNGTISGLNGEIGSLQANANKIDKAVAEYEQAIKDAQSVGAGNKYDGGDFAWPVPGYYGISSPYGYRSDPFTGKRKFHKGIDIAGGGIKGKPIVAAADGTVSLASYNAGGYGNYVMINHGKDNKGDNYVSLYAHMTKYIVKVGQNVKKGQTIGYVGTTGASTGYHLHFEIRVNNNTTNPMSYY